MTGEGRAAWSLTAGATAEVGPLGPSDGEEFLELCLALDRESSLMMLESDERARNVDVVRRELAAAAAADDARLGARVDGELAGYVALERGRFRRNRHSAELVLGVRARFGGRGVGGHLLQAAERWARKRGVDRIELTVMEHNGRARRLYERCGYVVEGRRTRSLIVDGREVAELSMARLWDRPGV